MSFIEKSYKDPAAGLLRVLPDPNTAAAAETKTTDATIMVTLDVTRDLRPDFFIEALLHSLVLSVCKSQSGGPRPVARCSSNVYQYQKPERISNYSRWVE
jgi:hypothetical protein